MALTVDQFLEVIGQLGLYQWRTLILFVFLFLPHTYQTLVMYFLAMDPPWKCRSFGNSTYNPLCNSTQIYTSGSDDFTKRCSMNRSLWEYAPYDYDGPRNTIVMEWDLVCSDSAFAWLASSMHFIGWSVGAIVLGVISDKYGRKSVLFPSIFCVMFAGFIIAFVKVYWLFLVCRFFVGFGEGGAGLTMFVLATELVGPQKRAFAGTLVWFYFTAALCLLGLQAYFVRDWRTLCMIVSAPYAFCLLFWKFIPESIRWLLVNNKIEKAEELLHEVARLNKTEMPKGEQLLKPEDANVKSRGMSELFNTRYMLMLTLIQCYTWFVNGMVYYGVSYGSNDLGGSLYLNYVLTSLVEIPGNMLVIHNANRYGRRPTTIAHMVIGGTACIAVSAIPAGTGRTDYIVGRVLGALIGKMCITTSFNTIYVYSAELFPTVVRSGGMGLVQVISRIGAATAPFIVEIDRIQAMLPFLVMGGMTFIAAVLCWFLPETLGKPTLEVFGQEEVSASSVLDEKEKDMLSLELPKFDDINTKNTRNGPLVVEVNNSTPSGSMFL